MRLSRSLSGGESSSIDGLAMGMESHLRRVKRADLHKRQRGLLGDILGGGNSLIGGLLGGNNNNNNNNNNNDPKTPTPPPPTTTTTTTTTEEPKPPPTTAAPIQAPPTTTQAPPAQIKTTQAPIVQQPAPPVSSSKPVIQPSTIPIALPVETGTPNATPPPGSDDSGPSTTAKSVFPSQSLSPSSSLLAPNPLSSITSSPNGRPTTFATSTLRTSTTISIDDATTANPIMGGSESGRGGIDTMAIVIGILVVIFGTGAIIIVAFYISKNYIRKRKITIALETRVSQMQNYNHDNQNQHQNQHQPRHQNHHYNHHHQSSPPPHPPPSGPLPLPPVPVPMRMRFRDEAVTFMQRFPKPPSVKEISRGGLGGLGRSRSKEKGFVVLR